MGVLSSVRQVMKNVLVIEDEPDIMMLVKMVLESEGYNVSEMSGAAGYETKVRDAHADLVLLDLNIAGFDGNIICEYIKAQTDLKSIPVIIMSGNLDAQQIKDECGADDIISKPFDLDRFVGMVKHYVN